eukprot:CAMPEP_0117550994 /NCGR_PEP_ID=MMETSP0784-20121206/48963_1 /TAXON_ID=39447 /ORGANISM="" /LENGTH=139 /DNA_ID=CAMNT_0005348021 /DNA_START=1 /DNA_END=416 /DNA_ORIENTATION=+
MLSLRPGLVASLALWRCLLAVADEVPAETIPTPPEEVQPPPLDPDDHMHQSRERHLRELAPTGVHHMTGLWVYGDYRSVPEATTPIDCSTACENDEGCLHWNFHVVHHVCDLKHHSSGHNEGALDWISGNAARYVPPGA